MSPENVSGHGSLAAVDSKGRALYLGAGRTPESDQRASAGVARGRTERPGFHRCLCSASLRKGRIGRPGFAAVRLSRRDDWTVN